MEIRKVVVEMKKNLNAREASDILRSVGTILIPLNVPGDSFPYDIGSFFGEGEGCVTYKPLLEGGMLLTFTPFYTKSRILELEERVKRLMEQAGMEE